MAQVVLHWRQNCADLNYTACRSVQTRRQSRCVAGCVLSVVPSTTFTLTLNSSLKICNWFCAHSKCLAFTWLKQKLNPMNVNCSISICLFSCTQVCVQITTSPRKNKYFSSSFKTAEQRFKICSFYQRQIYKREIKRKDKH